MYLSCFHIDMHCNVLLKEAQPSRQGDVPLKENPPDRELHGQEPDVSGIASRNQSILEGGLRQIQQQTASRTD